MVLRKATKQAGPGGVKESPYKELEDRGCDIGKLSEFLGELDTIHREGDKCFENGNPHNRLGKKFLLLGTVMGNCLGRRVPAKDMTPEDILGLLRERPQGLTTLDTNYLTREVDTLYGDPSSATLRNELKGIYRELQDNIKSIADPGGLELERHGWDAGQLRTCIDTWCEDRASQWPGEHKRTEATVVHENRRMGDVLEILTGMTREDIKKNPVRVGEELGKIRDEVKRGLAKKGIENLSAVKNVRTNLGGYYNQDFATAKETETDKTLRGIKTIAAPDPGLNTEPMLENLGLTAKDYMNRATKPKKVAGFIPIGGRVLKTDEELTREFNEDIEGRVKSKIGKSAEDDKYSEGYDKSIESLLLRMSSLTQQRTE